MKIDDVTDLAGVLRNALEGLMPTIQGGTADSRDELIVRYTRGRGRFSADKKFITLDMKISTLAGEEDGTHQGVWEAQFKTPQELLQIPKMPPDPMDVPKGPVPHLEPLAQTKAIWSFADGSSITVVGPAVSHLIPLKDGSLIFMVSTSQVFTNGTGRYQGVVGVNQSLGAAHIPAGVDFFGPASATFEATTLDTFKVVRRRYNRPFVAPGAPATASSGPAAPGPPGAETSGKGAEAVSPAYPFNTKQIEVRKSMMSYIDEGEGDAFLFLHGNPTWSYLWRNIIPVLKPLGRCIAPDLIGMGRSEKPHINYSFLTHYGYLEEFIQKLGLERITLVLHDWGSALGFHYANLNRAKIKGMAFMEALLKPYDTWADFPAKNAPAQLRDAFRAYRSDKGFDLIVKQNLFMKQTEGLAGRPLSPEETANYEAPFQTEESREVILSWTHQLPIEGDPADVTKAVAEYAKYLQQSDVPKLLFYTEPGGILFKEHVEWCRQNLSHLETVDLEPPTAKAPIHLLQEKYPAAIGQIIANWYKGFTS